MACIIGELFGCTGKQEVRLGDLNFGQVKKAMANEGVAIDLGIASFRVRSKLTPVVKNFYSLYASHTLVGDDQPVDFHVKVKSSSSLRKWIYPQVEFVCDQHSPFLPLPKSQAYPVLEWGMNWCIATHCHNFLLIHSAVLAKDGKAIMFPAPPGSGKSTLTAYLANTGWQLLSDEMAVIDTNTGLVHPFSRPICLKNNSIDLVKEWFPDVVVSDVARDTNKGDVAHVKPPLSSLEGIGSPAKITAVVFPKFDASVDIEIYQLDKCTAFLSLAENGFNNNILAKDGFSALVSIAEQANNYEVNYSNMDEMVSFLDDEIENLN